MRLRLPGFLLICSLVAYGCGGSGPGKVDSGDSGLQDATGVADRAPNDRPADSAADAGDGRTDAAADRAGDGAASDGGNGDRDAGAGDGAGGGAGDGGDVDSGRVDAGTDVPAPTCSDQIKNSDETDIDCGGHCGKCGPDRSCLVAGDCTFGICRTDHTCGACAVASDCPGAETECQHRSCTAGVCGVARDPVGTVVVQQTSGDCKSRQCAADGTAQPVNDNSDIPDDRNACTNDSCMAGTPSNTNLPVNSSCGGLNRCNDKHECVGCSTAADCPGVDTPCQTRTCSPQGTCSFTFTTAGIRLTDPTAGDCKALQCDGSGNTQVVTDNTDLPVDNNACTTDECVAGTPSHRPVASGTGCGGGLLCDGANHCVECLSASTCPGTDTECRPRSCVNGACGFSNTVGGTVKAAQVSKDCKRVLCNGAGGDLTVPDITDLPVDGNPCTADLCTGDTPSNPPLAAGTNCGGTSVCDGQGACVGCLTAATCPGTDTECHTRTCSATHMCGLSNAAPGQPLALQTLGDCKKNQCDGNGNPQTVNDNTDLPIDGNVCTQDLCVGGMPSNPPEASGTACGAGLLCDGARSCVGCRTVADCPGSDSACQTRVCTGAGHCDVSNVAPGTVLSSQNAGDCRRAQCDGMGNVVSVADDSDLPVDGNQCTQDLCIAGTPSNPPEPIDTACAQGGGSRCNGVAGAEACVQCNSAGQCPGGPDTECSTRTCSASGICGLSFTTAGTVVSSQTARDCKRSQCNGNGAVVVVADAADLPVDGNGCTQDLCDGSNPMNSPEPMGTPCSDGSGSVCNGAGSCLQCNVAADCPGGPDTECHTRVCTLGVCSVHFTDSGTLVAAQTGADCHVNVCNGAGTIVPAVDDADVFVDGNSCTQDLCSNGSSSNPPVAAGTTCSQNGGSLCDAGGTCVQCLNDANCDSSHDTDCNKIHCVAGACLFVPEDVNTPATDRVAGDCHRDVCDGAGSTVLVVNDADLPVDGSACTQDVCTGGVVTNPAEAVGTACSQNGGTRCDATASCVPSFMVVRIGDGTATVVTNAATPVFVEERLESDGALVRTISIPSAAGTAPKPLTLSGTADSEGALALSGDGHSVSFAGYSAAAGTAAVASTTAAAVPRAGAIVLANGTVDTSTTFGTVAFGANNVRSAVSNNGAQLWAAGNGAGATRGVFFALTGATTSALIESASNSTRSCEIVAGQLYCDAANGALGIFAVGTGLPTTTAVNTPLPGTTVDANASYYAFVLLDMVGNDGVLDTLYIADDRATALGGIQKWTLNAGTWTQVWVTNTVAGTVGVRGLTGYAAGSSVVLLATTASASPAPNSIIRLIDTGTTPTAASITTLVQATPGAVTVYRGIALSPQ